MKKLGRVLLDSFTAFAYIIRESLPIIYGVAVPAIVLVLSELNLMEIHDPYRVALWGLVCVLFIFGFFSRRLAGGNIKHSIFVGLVAVAIGIMIIDFRIMAETAKTYI